MLENLQKGDKLFRDNDKERVLGVCGEVVFLERKDGEIAKMPTITTFEELRQKGWQLEKKKWVPGNGERYWIVCSGGGIIQCYWCNDAFDEFRFSTNNIHKTKEEAEAYRNKLVEVMGREQKF